MRPVRRITTVIDWGRRLQWIVTSVVAILPVAVPVAATMLAYVRFAPGSPAFAAISESFIVGLVFFIGLAGTVRAFKWAQSKFIPTHNDREILHDNILWRDIGGSRVVDIEGPLCPKDKATLRYAPTSYSGQASETVHRNNMISQYHGYLVCPECQSRIYTSPGAKMLGESREQVESRFEGRRRLHPERFLKF